MKRSRKVVDEVSRFWSKVDKSGDCWLWTAGLRLGYGQFRRTHDRGNPAVAHRYAYEITKGQIPAGMQLDHLCRNRACVNPDHLEPVSQRVNMLRGLQSRLANGMDDKCAHGHRYTPENTYRNPSRASDIRCRECSRIRDRARRSEKRKAA